MREEIDTALDLKLLPAAVKILPEYTDLSMIEEAKRRLRWDVAAGLCLVPQESLNGAPGNTKLFATVPDSATNLPRSE
ncbi:MAG TPA: hypothetical protein VN656_02570 [Stellaceae bacterium]|nr:hypothetical protein [Stellaceae bacterium]